MRRFLIALLFLIAASMGFTFACKEGERKALLKFKHSFKSLYLDFLMGSWVGEDCCSWNGVGCSDNVTGNVVKLDMKGGRCLEAEEVNPALLELKYLTYLDLRFIDFGGSSIPEFFGSMRQLQYLYLSGASFGGEVPHSLGNLTNLVVLDLGFSYWSSETKTNSLEWAFKLENLQELDLSGINLSQALDSLNIIHKLPSLSALSLSGCQLGNSHVIQNTSVSSSLLQQLDLGGNLFSVTIPHFIQNLSYVKYLDLSSNHFTSIPSWLGSKIHLEQLGLSSISFSGSFPLFIQNLTLLTSLDLSNNQFSSSIPSWLANQRYLEYLDLKNNHFNRVDRGIMNIIGSLCRLNFLDLSYNQLQEEVLEPHVNVSRCSRYDLEYLFMQNNNMSGQLPTIGSLLSLQELDLSHNSFEIIPASFGKLSSLESLNLSYNRLSVVKQANLANLSSLGSLDMSSNFLTLELSPDWVPPFQLVYLYIPHCKLNNPFPKWLLNQSNILQLDLSDTGIFGPIPESIGNAMPSLQVLQFANNDINGSIPRSLCRLVGLGVIDLQNNTLSGTIPADNWVTSQMVVVDLSSNRIFGHIPNSLVKLATLQLLSLNNNLLEGELPLLLSNSTQLTIFDVGRNKLDGEIPPWNGAKFPILQILILRENRFTGQFPQQLCSFHGLQIIDLASNNFAGSIPDHCFGNFQRMRSIQQSYVSIAPSISPSPTASDVAAEPSIDPSEWRAVEVIKGEDLEYTTTLHMLANIDLSCNNLVGVIPAEITSLSLLLGLNLSHNRLNGTIPMEIGKMSSLESLDLSFNNLSGSIPESISSLDSLSKMNFSFNNLQGQIPTGRHFDTLQDPSIYTRNPSLCGDPLPKKCTGDGIAHPPTSTVLEDGGDDKHEKMWFYLVIMSGFATSFWGVIGILVVHKKWRHAYFQIAEELTDWIYVRVAVRISQANRRR